MTDGSLSARVHFHPVSDGRQLMLATALALAALALLAYPFGVVG